MLKALTTGQSQALYYLLATRSDFRLKFEGKVDSNGESDETMKPAPVNTTVGDKDYIVTRLAGALYTSLGVKVTFGSSDVTVIANILFENGATDIGSVSPSANPARKTNITRDIGKIKVAISPYQDNSPCPNGADQGDLYDFFNPSAPIVQTNRAPGVTINIKQG